MPAKGWLEARQGRARGVVPWKWTRRAKIALGW
jgi:hypothetical protein